MDKVLLVTGGSRGIGAASCRLAARQGWTVAVNYTANAAAAQAVVDEIRASGGRALAVPTDLTDPSAIETMGWKYGTNPSCPGRSDWRISARRCSRSTDIRLTLPSSAGPAARARPKSRIFTSPSLVTKTLSGLKSRCTTLRSCAAARPRAICSA